jgi:hypothetical protein
MRKILTAAVAALTVAGGVAAVSGPAQAEPYRYYRHKDKNNDAGVAIAAGVVGLALGAALASSNNNRRSSSYYNNGYYQPNYGGGYYGNSYYRNSQPYYGGRYSRPYAYQDRYAYSPRVCVSRERVYDRYTGRPMTIKRQYAC